MILIFSLLVIFFTLSRLIVQKQLKEENNEELLGILVFISIALSANAQLLWKYPVKD